MKKKYCNLCGIERNVVLAIDGMKIKVALSYSAKIQGFNGGQMMAYETKRAQKVFDIGNRGRNCNGAWNLQDTLQPYFLHPIAIASRQVVNLIHCTEWTIGRHRSVIGNRLLISLLKAYRRTRFGDFDPF